MESRNKLLELILSQLSGAAGGVLSVLGLQVDNTDPLNPIIPASVLSCTGETVDNTDPYNPIVNQLHFGAFTVDVVPVSNDSANPTYLTGIVLAGSSSPEFTLVIAPDGSQLIKNTSAKTFPMEGSATYQIVQGAGGGAEFFLWSEKSIDDGVTFIENAFSLRTSDVPNNRAGSQTKTAAVGSWAPGESIRWAMYRTGGEVTLSAPSTAVNGGNVVSGFTFFWQLNQV